ncbi:protein-(glutamine-N5) methyltransferase, release factor-specific [Bifidobacterium margollesii]|uniref:Release factor glutamine methyltransferase n=2 Tax=Bifidobacterium margollesii TaxID=2020964 RepID=A0A2N5JBE0_9BIFI|nr:protein-(glutamine-N5) methyltransferase, release factor-specific [Bifidobacterium margollesii]
MNEPSIAGLLNDAARILAQAGIDTPRFDAKLLLAHAAGVEPRNVDKAMLLGADPDELNIDEPALRRMIDRRAEREPLQYIIGTAPFRYLEVEVGPGVFIPRPETEIVVQAGLDWLTEQHVEHPRIVDLCAGSGVIGLSAVTEIPDSEVWAVEFSADTYRWTDRNRKRILLGEAHDSDDHDSDDDRIVRNGRAGDGHADGDRSSAYSRYHLILGDATDSETLKELDGTIDLVISNPPYIPESEIPEQPEVRDHDPALALYGGSADGLRIPRLIIDRSAALLRSGGVLVMEHDIGQGPALVDHALQDGFSEAHTGDDLTGRPRYLFARTKQLADRPGPAQGAGF